MNVDPVRVRVLRVHYGPREKSSFPDGKSEERYWEAGQSTLIPAEQHLPENLTDKPLDILSLQSKPGRTMAAIDFGSDWIPGVEIAKCN